MGKNIFIVLGLILFLVFIAVLVANTNNTAVGYEERVMEQHSVVEAQLQRRIDLIGSLVDTVENQRDFEQDTLIRLAEARSAVSEGRVEDAQLAINAVVEAYPQITTSASYIQLMNEISITENLIIEQRKTFNNTVKDYRQFTRKFPNSLILNILGYTAGDYEYLDFDVDNNWDTNLFE